MGVGFLDKFIQPALSNHSRGWKTWVQGEPLQIAAEWVRNNLTVLPNAAQDSAFAVGSAFWKAGETLDAAVGQKISAATLLEDVRAVDQRVLRALQQNNFLKFVPNLVYEWAQPDLETPGQTIAHGDGGGEIKMFLKSSGRLTQTEHAPHTLAHQMNKWMILFHEAAHGEFFASPNIFSLNKGEFSQEDIQYINTWGMQKMFYSSTTKALSESFSDVYGAMMLLEGFNHSAESVQAVTDLLQLRKSSASDNEYCACTTALTLLLKDRLLWKDQPASVLKDLARQYSSAAIMIIGKQQDPEDPNGLLRNLVAPKMHVLPFFFEFCVEYRRQTHRAWMAQMDKHYAAVPLWSHLKDICTMLEEELNLAQTDQRPSPLWDALNTNDDPHQLWQATHRSLSNAVKRGFMDLEQNCPMFVQTWSEFKAVQDYFQTKCDTIFQANQHLSAQTVLSHRQNTENKRAVFTKMN